MFTRKEIKITKYKDNKEVGNLFNVGWHDKELFNEQIESEFDVIVNTIEKWICIGFLDRNKLSKSKTFKQGLYIKNGVKIYALKDLFLRFGIRCGTLLDKNKFSDTECNVGYGGFKITFQQGYFIVVSKIVSFFPTKIFTFLPPGKKWNLKNEKYIKWKFHFFPP